MYIKKLFQVFTAIVLSSLATASMAHSGHGGDVGMSHDLEHMLWTLVAVGVVAAGLMVVNKRKGLRR